MQNSIIAQEISRYNLDTIEDVKNAFREIGQKIVLAGLARGKIFEHVAFYGGTSLRILHNLDRFSEDLDFTLLHDFDNFNLLNYLSYASEELNNYGLVSEYVTKDKSIDSSVLTGYVKFNLQKAIDFALSNHNFKVNKEEMVSIKVEVETKHYDGYETEYKTILFPSYFKVLTFNINTLFSCKLLAVLNRSWKTRVKGRDYFDFLYYMTNQVKPNYNFLANGLGLDAIDREELIILLTKKFNEVDFVSAKKDVLPFLKPNSRFIDLFEKDIFIDILSELK